MQIIKKQYAFLLFFLWTTHTIPFSLVIDPSQNNRIIGSEYEKNIAQLYAESIRTYIYNDSNNTLSIELTRMAGEVLEPLQAATFSNIINPNLHIAIQCAPTLQPEIFIYYRQLHPDDKQLNYSQKLHFTPASESYLYTYETSKKYAEKIYQALLHYKTITHIHTPIGCPVQSLFGIHSPAVMIEIGIKKESNFTAYTKLLAETLSTLVLEMEDLT